MLQFRNLRAILALIRHRDRPDDLAFPPLSAHIFVAARASRASADGDLLALVSAVALALVVYLLWPTWRASAPDDPAHLPITIGSALFNVPAKAIRMRMQRRAGPQERIDLAFDYPSLAPPEPQAHVTADDRRGQAGRDQPHLPVDRRRRRRDHADRARCAPIYPRYVEAQADTQDGLTGRAFRDSSPYRGEDLFMADSPRSSPAARAMR